MDIAIYSNQGTTILTFQGTSITSRTKDLTGRTIEQRSLCPLSIQPHPKVLSNINIRMNMIQVEGNIHAIEQNIRIEVEVQSMKEYELKRLQQQLKNISITTKEISTILYQM
jgi:hypothetical protein